MQRQADALVASLRDFIAQRDYPTLVVNGNEAAVILTNKSLAALDRQDDGAYYLLFPEPCTSAPAYAGAVAGALSNQIEILNTELAARQSAPIRPLPLEVVDGRVPAPKRLRMAIEHCGAHLPGEAPIVWGLLPGGQLTDAAGYRDLIGPLLAPKAIEPWMDRHRFLVRDPQTPSLSQELLAAKNDRVLVIDLDFSNERFAADLAQTAGNRALPPDERMNAFFQLGAVDFALRRYPEALEKYGVCFNYFQSKNDKPMQALCLSGAADTLREAGRPDQALEFYQRSIAVSMEDKNLPLLQQGLFGAGCMCLETRKNQEAYGYLQHANEVASKLRNPFAKCDAMEKLGLAAWRLGKIQEAVDIWLKAKDLAKQFTYDERAISILSLLIALSRQSALDHRAGELERERASLAGSPSVVS